MLWHIVFMDCCVKACECKSHFMLVASWFVFHVSVYFEWLWSMCINHMHNIFSLMLQSKWSTLVAGSLGFGIEWEPYFLIGFTPNPFPPTEHANFAGTNTITPASPIPPNSFR